MRCLRVYSRVQLYSAATSGKKVAWQYLPLKFDLMMIPCLPTYQSKAFLPSWKLTRRETPTFNNLTSFIWTGSNLSSSKADIKAYFPKMVDSCAGAKVPMHPLRSSLIFQVTKMGTLGSGSVCGQGGRGLLVSLAMRTSKQYLQCCFVASGLGFIKIQSNVAQGIHICMSAYIKITIIPNRQSASSLPLASQQNPIFSFPDQSSFSSIYLEPVPSFHRPRLFILYYRHSRVQAQRYLLSLTACTGLLNLSFFSTPAPQGFSGNCSHSRISDMQEDGTGNGIEKQELSKNLMNGCFRPQYECPLRSTVNPPTRIEDYSQPCKPFFHLSSYPQKAQ